METVETVVTVISAGINELFQALSSVLLVTQAGKARH